jgi:hypothetical protein
LQAEASFLDEAAAPSTYAVLARVSPGYPPLLGRLPTCYSPVRRSKVAEATFAHDLHVLSTPPAFILSQDQTLQLDPQQLKSAKTLTVHFVRNTRSLLQRGGERFCGSESFDSSSIQFSKNRRPKGAIFQFTTTASECQPRKRIDPRRRLPCGSRNPAQKALVPNSCLKEPACLQQARGSFWSTSPRTSGGE